MSNNPSPEELRRLQELSEMFDGGPSMPPVPSPERSAPSLGASEVMNAAKHWGRVFGSKAKELSEKAVEKSREAQDAIARRAAEANAKKQAERAQDVAVIPSAAPDELLQVEPEPMAPPRVMEPAVDSEGSGVLSERRPEIEASAEEAVKAPRENAAAAATAYDKMGTLPQLRALSRQVVAPVIADHHSPSVPKIVHQGATVASAIADHAHNNGPSRKKGYQTFAAASFVVLVLAGTTAWWVTRQDSETPAVPAATPARAAVPRTVTTPRPAPVVDPIAVAVPAKRVPATALQEEFPPENVVILPVAAPTATPVPAHTPEAKPRPKGSTSAVRPVAKPKAATITAPQPKPDETNGWQQKADGDMDAWAKKNGIN